MTDHLDPVSEAIAALGAGEIVVVSDDDDREGEGDLVMAASLATPEKLAFIVRYTSGIVCVPVTEVTAKRLHLEPMVARNNSTHATAFTVSVDYEPTTTTGISAEERSATCRALARSDVEADAFIRPGHIFPLIAREGGVLMRSGHTEAAVDLCVLAGLPAIGVISELVNDDGSITKGAEVRAFAERHHLRHITVAQLISHRQSREKLVERQSTFTCESRIGLLQGFTYVSPFDDLFHMAFVHGDIGPGERILTRFHRPNFAEDIFGGARTVNLALDWFEREGAGVLIFLRDGAAGVPVRPLRDDSDSVRVRAWREVGVGSQILKDLGIHSIRHLSTRRNAYVGVSGFGVEIAEHLPLESVASSERKAPLD